MPREDEMGYQLPGTGTQIARGVPFEMLKTPGLVFFRKKHGEKFGSLI